MNQALLELVKRHREKVSYRDRNLEMEQKDLEDRLDQIKAERSGFVDKFTRSEAYKPALQICPVCWIDNGLSIKLKPMPGDNGFDKFKCGHCGTQLDVELED